MFNIIINSANIDQTLPKVRLRDYRDKQERKPPP